MAQRKPKPDNTNAKPAEPETSKADTKAAADVPRIPAGPNNRSLGDPRIDRGGV